MSHKIQRDAFLFLRGNVPDFSQCSSCMMWSGSTGEYQNICAIHGKSIEVTGRHSCGLYVHGKPGDEHGKMAKHLVSPKESGLVKRPVRCENCQHFDGKAQCNLYVRLNMTGDLWDLDPKVKPLDCCNANTPIDGGAEERAMGQARALHRKGM